MAINVENHGSIILLRPDDAEAQNWLAANTNAESWQWFAGALAVEPRYADAILEGAQAAGLEICLP